MVDAALGVQVVGGAGGGDLDDELGRSKDVITLGDPAGAQALGLDAQEGVGLDLVLLIQVPLKQRNPMSFGGAEGSVFALAESAPATVANKMSDSSTTVDRFMFELPTRP